LRRSRRSGTLTRSWRRLLRKRIDNHQIGTDARGERTLGGIGSLQAFVAEAAEDLDHLPTARIAVLETDARCGYETKLIGNTSGSRWIAKFGEERPLEPEVSPPGFLTPEAPAVRLRPLPVSDR